MNLFKKYGIKEVADVTFYSIIEIGDEEFYIPILTLDTLKITTIDQKVQDVVNNGGYGNSKVMSWSFGKDITLKIQDALCSAASLSMTYGWLNSKLSIYTSLIRKINIANKFFKLNYSIYAYPSPKLTKEEFEELCYIVSRVYSDANQKYLLMLVRQRISFGSDFPDFITKDFINEPYVAAAREKIKEIYKTRKENAGFSEFCDYLVQLIFTHIKNVQDYYKIDTDNYDLEVIDRMEPCFVTKDEGIQIDFEQQWQNLKDYFNNDKTHSYTIFYDSRTMQPLVSNYDGTLENNVAILKKGTLYYKWTRTIQQKIDDKDMLGKTLIINSNIFPDKFRIVGETYIREQKTLKDSRYQFIIPKAQISNNTNISLSAEGEPTIFSMDITVLNPDNENMMELRQFDVIEDEEFGGTKVLPQQTEYTRTQLNIPNLKQQGDIENKKIY